MHRSGIAGDNTIHLRLWRSTPRKISDTRLQRATGLSRQGVANGINGLGSLITIKAGPKNERVENEYALNLDIATGELVNGV